MPAAKPTATKAMQGTLQPCRTNRREPKPAIGAEPPAWLQDAGLEFWYEFAPILTRTRVLTEADRQALAVTCDALAEYVHNRKIVRSEGSTYETTTERGSVMYRARPEVAAAADAYRRFIAGADRFGLAPAPRAKVNAEPDGPADPFESFLKGRPS